MGDIGQSIASAASAPKVTTIDRIYESLNIQNDLIGMMDTRLNVVSNRSPQDENEKMDSHVHLENIAYRIEQSNKELQRLINELVV